MVVKKTTKKSSVKKTVKKSSQSKPKNAAVEKMGSCCVEKNSCTSMVCKDTSGCIYFLGFVGAAVFYIMQATSFWTGVLGVLKALVWPAMLVFHLLGL